MSESFKIIDLLKSETLKLQEAAERIHNVVHNNILGTYAQLYKVGFTHNEQAIKANKQVNRAFELAGINALMHKYKGKYQKHLFVPNEAVHKASITSNVQFEKANSYVGEIPRHSAHIITSFGGVAFEDRRYVKKIFLDAVTSKSIEIDYETYNKLSNNPDATSLALVDSNFYVMARSDLLQHPLEESYPLPIDVVVLYSVHGGYLVITSWNNER